MSAEPGTLRLLRESFRYAAPFKARFALRYLLALISVLPIVLLPWPVKMIVDHALLGIPVGAQAVPYPAFIAPAAELLQGLSPGEIITAMVAVQLLLVVLVGAVGTSGNERDSAEAVLSAGHDVATRSENEANFSISLTGGLLGLLDWRVMIRLSQEINHHYRSTLFRHIGGLPLAHFDDESVGDAVHRVMYDTPSITEGIYRSIVWPPVWGAMALLLALALASSYPGIPLLWQAALALTAIAFFVPLPFAGAMRRRSAEARQRGAEAVSKLEEGLHNMRAVQSLGGEARGQSEFARGSWASFSRFRSFLGLGMVIFALCALPALPLFAYVAYTLFALVIEERISAGDLGLIAAWFLSLCYACLSLGALWIRVQENAAGLARVALLLEQPQEQDPPGARACPPLQQGVRIEGAGYDYPDGTPALRDIHLDIPRGRVTALVGPAGGGKTTLACLLPRLVVPTSGRVLFDGEDCAQFSLASLRARIAFVFQETQLFDADLEENIRVGKADASQQEIRRAARLAGVAEFAERLPEGYRTRLGRGGARLSVGQRQRLAVARALVRGADLLVLDEPTSALDPETERRLMDALGEASRDCAVLLIAHRLGTVRAASKIAFVEAGRIVEAGGHAALMARPGGAYRRFVELAEGGAAD